ncbi:MAG: transglutaminase domain-containing protein [Candidatus Heimdallarchaeota archaeon]|nr:transglutaminase domain-containing protein [Candidatus Heimdallarchaeota archaeon]
MEMKSDNEIKITKDAFLLIKRIAIDISSTGLKDQSITFEMQIPTEKVSVRDRTGKLSILKLDNNRIQVNLRDTPASKGVYGFVIKALIKPEISKFGPLSIIEWPALDLYRVSMNVKPYQILGFKNIIKEPDDDFWMAEENVTSKITSHIASKRSARIEVGATLPKVYLRGTLSMDCSAGGRIQSLELNCPQNGNRHKVITTSTVDYILKKDNQGNERIIIENPCDVGEKKLINFSWMVSFQSIDFYQQIFDYPSRRAYDMFKGKQYFKSSEFWSTNHKGIQKVAKAAEEYKDIWTIHKFLFEFTNRRIEYNANGVRYSAAKAFDEKIGDCSEFADLLITLHRLAGIPSRLVEGQIILPSSNGYTAEGHAWLEFLSPNGWIPSDPTWGIPIGVSIQHIEFQRQETDQSLPAFKYVSIGPKPMVEFNLEVEMVE